MVVELFAGLLDLDVADELAALRRSCLAGVQVAPYSGPALLLDLVEGSGEPEDQTVLLARDGDRLVGWARATAPVREYTDCLFLSGCVAPDRQGQGIGRAPLADLHERLPGPFRLKCLTANLPALAFYQKLGWTEIDRGRSADGEFLLMDSPVR